MIGVEKEEGSLLRGTEMNILRKRCRVNPFRAPRS